MITAVAAGLLALLHGMDLLQGLLGLPYTVHDLWMMMGRADVAEGDFVLQVPWNLAQTAVLMVLSVIALLGGLICLGRRRGAARIGGAFAVLAAVLPLTLPLLFPALQMMGGPLEDGWWTSTLLFVGVPSLVSASGLVTGLIAVILLVGGSPRGSRPPGTVLSVVGIVFGSVFTLEALVALLGQTMSVASWWGVGWIGLVGFGSPTVLLLSLLLVVVMVAAGIGSGLLLGSASLLTRIGGGLLAAALMVRVATQAVTWGMGYYLQVRGAYTFDYTWVWPIEWTNAIVVPLFAVPGILLAIIGQFTGPRPAPTAAGGPSGPSGPSVPGGSSAL